MNALYPVSTVTTLDAYLAIIRECEHINAQADLNACLRAPKVGTTEAATIAPAAKRTSVSR